MKTLLLRLEGPAQAWGIDSVGPLRSTRLEPSKSGVLGLVAAALGRDRTESVADLAALRFGVRVDRQGLREVDFQTVRGVPKASGSGVRDQVSERHYLADAVFLAALEGDAVLLHRVRAALRNPVWGLSLGRRAFLPSAPIALPHSIMPMGLESALRTYPSLVEDGDVRRRLVLESDDGTPRQDQPLASFEERQYGIRFVRTTFMEGGDLGVSNDVAVEPNFAACAA